MSICKADASSGKASTLRDLMRLLGKDKFRIELLAECPFSSPDQTKATELKGAQQFGTPSLHKEVPSGPDFWFRRLFERLADVEMQVHTLKCKFGSAETPLTYLTEGGPGGCSLDRAKTYA